MISGVNLIPASHLHAQARAHRRTAWIGICISAGVLLASGWMVQRLGAKSLARLSDQTGAMELQRSEVQRRLLAASAKRAELLRQLETAAAARRPQVWPRRLLELTRLAPDGVFLTQFSVAAPAAETTAASVATPRGTPRAKDRTRPPEPDTQLQAIHLLGYAVDHGALIQFLNVLQSLPGWQHIELVRATQEPYGGGVAVAFEFDCQAKEATP